MRSHGVTVCRFYYQTYTPATATAALSHKKLLRMYYQVRHSSMLMQLGAWQWPAA